MLIDARGKPCPMPLMLAKKEIDAGVLEFSIKVDNETAVKNLSRLASKKGLLAHIIDIPGGFQLDFGEGGNNAGNAEAALGSSVSTVSDVTTMAQSGCSVFISRDVIGQGDATLGYNLMKMALYTLSEMDLPPVSLLFMNNGVKLLTRKEHQIKESVEKLMDKGTEVLVCGTCLEYYDLTEELELGEISNMYDILERMGEASKVITL